MGRRSATDGGAHGRAKPMAGVPPVTDGGEYVLLHLGLLMDERFIEMDERLFKPWAILELLLRREPVVGVFEDHARVVWLLKRVGGYTREEAEDRHAGLLEAGWLIEDGTGVTLRGWSRFAYRPGRIDERPTTREGRRQSGEAHLQPVRHGAAPVRHGAGVPEKKGEEKKETFTSQNEETRDRIKRDELDQRAREYQAGARPRGKLTPMGEMLKAAGLHPSLLPNEEDDA